MFLVLLLALLLAFGCGFAVQTMFKNEGIRAFYKGGAVNALCTPAARGLYMGGASPDRAATAVAASRVTARTC